MNRLDRMSIRNMLAISLCSANFVIVVTEMNSDRTWIAETCVEMIGKLEKEGMADSEFMWFVASPDQIRFIIFNDGER